MLGSNFEDDVLNLRTVNLLLEEEKYNVLETNSLIVMDVAQKQLIQQLIVFH